MSSLDPKIAAIRNDYALKNLNESEAEKSPIAQFQNWWNEAIEANIDEVNAMALATVGLDAQPNVRIVLLKSFDDDGFVFFTNYESKKGQDILHNPHVAVCFFWKELQRQVRIRGVVQKCSKQISDEYFLSRPEGSQIGAWASPQSKVVEDRNVLEDRVEEMELKFKEEELHRPDFWGGYVIKPTAIEFWQGRTNRLHDRLLYSINGKEWKIERLAP